MERTKKDSREEIKALTQLIAVYRSRPEFWSNATTSLRELELRLTWMTQRCRAGDYREECEADSALARQTLFTY